MLTLERTLQEEFNLRDSWELSCEVRGIVGQQKDDFISNIDSANIRVVKLNEIFRSVDVEHGSNEAFVFIWEVCTAS